MVLYFSGTGNSAFAAKRIADTLGDEVLNLHEKLKSGDHSAMRSECPWVIVSPVYAWQMPHIVRDWLAETELQGSRDIYFVLTCGGGIAAAGSYAKALCEEKGMNYRGCAGIVMPENYIAMFSAPAEPEAREIVKAALPAIDAVSAQIAAGEPIPEKIAASQKFMSSIVNKGFYAGAIKDKKFTVSDACTGCGACERNCPLNNITLRDGKPVWNGNCTHCMACICRCPQGAIEYGKKSVGKPRYQCPKI